MNSLNKKSKIQIKTAEDELARQMSSVNKKSKIHKITTAEDELARKLMAFGYDEIKSFSMPEANRLLTLCERLEGKTHWYGGEKISYPPYEYMHDHLSGCSLDDAIKAVSAQYKGK